MNKKSAARQHGAKEVILNTLQTRVQKTIDYLNSERGRKNWSLNVSHGYSFYKNLFAAVQTATRLIKYENIIEVYDVVSFQWVPEKAA